LTVTARPPPSAGTTLDDALIDAVQRTAPGEVTLVADVDPQALTTIVKQASATSRRALCCAT
jgi:hypothetical protein